MIRPIHLEEMDEAVADFFLNMVSSSSSSDDEFLARGPMGSRLFITII